MDAAVLDGLLGGSAQEREESWRYSKQALRALSQQEFVAGDASAQVPPALIDRVDWPETRGARIVFVNGAYSKQHSDARAEIEHRSTRHSVLTIRDGAARTLHVIHANVPGALPSHWQARNDIHLERGSATIVEHHVGAAGSDVFGALASEIRVAAGADLRVVTISELPDSASLIRRQQAIVQADSRYRTTHTLGGGRLQRFDVGCELAAANARCEMRGVFALRARQHLDVQLDVLHAARDCTSNILWRGVADQRARGILRGAITVAAGADGSDAQLQTKNLLLSPHAEIDAQPVLEIYADEVKASHGATVGQLEERALFYLRSRGIDVTTARNLLIAGFCREAFDSIADQALRSRLDAWLAGCLPLAGDVA
jgi:Fe-S cluster assembly protein SufD